MRIVLPLTFVIIAGCHPDETKAPKPVADPGTTAKQKASAPVTLKAKVTLLADGTHRVQVTATPRAPLKRLVVRVSPHDSWLEMVDDPGEFSVDDVAAGDGKTITARVHLQPGRTYAYLTIFADVISAHGPSHQVISVLIGERGDSTPVVGVEGAPAQPIAPGEMPAPVATPGGGNEIQLQSTPAK